MSPGRAGENDAGSWLPQRKQWADHEGGRLDPRNADQAPWPRPGRSWYALIVLTLALFVATVDRNVLALLVEPIKKDLQLSDTQFSLLSGFAFVFY